MKELDLGTGNIKSLVKRFSIPCIISMVVAALYNIVDQIFIGWSAVGAYGNAATNIVYTVGRIISVGMASLIVQLSIVIIIAVNNNLLTKYGYQTYAGTGEAFGAVIPLAVVGIVMKVFGIVVSIVIGISLGGQPIIGYNMGAGNTERVKKTIQLITRLVLFVRSELDNLTTIR